MIQEMQDVMLGMDQVEIETKHSFCNGVYAREITIPAGVCLAGAKHKTSFFMTLSKGECMIRTENSMESVSAPCTLISKVGAKRIIYAVTETVMTTFHATDETDVVVIEKEIIEPEGLRITNNHGSLIK